MPVKRLKEFLNSHDVKYVTITHSRAFTAQEIAASAHIRGKELAKTVIVRLDGKMAMVVLPATYRVDFELLKEATGAGKVELASERDFKDAFPNCEVGAMPPFGNLYDMDTYVAASLTEDEDIAFNAGSHTELIRLPYREFQKHVQPQVLIFSVKA